MSNFIKTGSRKALLNKKKIAAQVEQAMEHDGENWSLLATGRDVGLSDEDALEKFGTFVVHEFNEGYEAGEYNGHTLFQKMVNDEMLSYYIKPVGLKKADGYDIWDFHINTNVKELFLTYLKEN